MNSQLSKLVGRRSRAVPADRVIGFALGLSLFGYMALRTFVTIHWGV